MDKRPDVESVRQRLAGTAQVVDEANRLPEVNRQILRDSGLYGTVANAPIDQAVRSAVEIGQSITAGCLATGFVWGQHQGALARLRFEVEMNSKRAESTGISFIYKHLAAGVKEAGIVYSGWPSHGRTIEGEIQDDGTLLLRGFAPFVTGWPWIDHLVMYVYEPSLDTVACVVVHEPRESISGYSEQQLELIAANASSTYKVEFVDSKIRPDGYHFIDRRPVSESKEVPTYVREYTSVLPLGVLRGIGQSAESVDADLAKSILASSKYLSNEVARAASTGDSNAMDAARGKLLHVTEAAAGALMKSSGSASALRGSEAARRVREAAFIQVASTTKRDRDASLMYIAQTLQTGNASSISP